MADGCRLTGGPGHGQRRHETQSSTQVRGHEPLLCQSGIMLSQLMDVWYPWEDSLGHSKWAHKHYGFLLDSWATITVYIDSGAIIFSTSPDDCGFSLQHQTSQKKKTICYLAMSVTQQYSCAIDTAVCQTSNSIVEFKYSTKKISLVCCLFREWKETLSELDRRKSEICLFRILWLTSFFFPLTFWCLFFVFSNNFWPVPFGVIPLVVPYTQCCCCAHVPVTLSLFSILPYILRSISFSLFQYGLILFCQFHLFFLNSKQFTCSSASLTISTISWRRCKWWDSSPKESTWSFPSTGKHTALTGPENTYGVESSLFFLLF